MMTKKLVPVLLGASAALGQLQAQPSRVRRLRVSPVDEKERTTKATKAESMFSESTTARDMDVDNLEKDFLRVLLRDSSMSMSTDPHSCLPDDVSPFRIQDDVDIGDVCSDEHGGGARACGKESCYRVQDNGDDPPYDPEEGDTLRFAYREVSSNNFSFEALVCGAGGDGSKKCEPDKNWSWEGIGRCGRIGLNIRESLDKFARGIFVHFEPFYELGVNIRKTNDEKAYGRPFDGSPDEDNCFWITVERNDDTFSFWYNDAKGGSHGKNLKRCEKGSTLEPDFKTTYSIDGMPKDVLVGLAVSTPVSNEDDGIEFYRRFTEAKFEHIALRIHR